MKVRPATPRSIHGRRGSPTGVLVAFALASVCTSCRDRRPSATEPGGTSQIESTARRIPRNYILVGPAGATATARPPLQPASPVTTAPGAARVGPGFGFVVTEERTVAGRGYVHIEDGRWLPASDVIPAHPSLFAGVMISLGETLNVAWVIAPETTVRAAPGASASSVTSRPAHTRVTLIGPCKSNWCPLAVGWIHAPDLAIPVRSPRPASAGPVERWLDVDLASQTLVAYRGDQPVYATLVSTGIGDPASPLATPVGVYRIRSKHELVRMDNLEHTGVVPYAYDVPLAQYFSDGKAIHAALWHHRFGHPTSHGCINMSPRDAEWLFAFTSPNLPRGTTEIVATATHLGTLLTIHGDLPKGPPR